MDDKNFINALRAHQREIMQLARRRLPIIIGRMAKDHFQNNFRLGGFVNNGLNKWKETKRQSAGEKGAASQYGPLLSSRNHLFSSIKYTPSDFQVVIANDLLYAPIHNWGGTLHPTVTPRMRRFAWAMFYKEAGKAKGKKKRAKAPMPDNPRASRWKALALTKKEKLSVNIPQRQFIGESRELSDAVAQRIENEISNILNK